MDHLLLSYGGFALLSGGVFALLPLRAAILTVFLGGWLLLPVGAYPEAAATSGWTWWIIGLALPSEMLVTKAWVAPMTALAWALLFDPGQLRRVRPSWLDLPLLAWCLWPLVAVQLAGAADPAAAVSAAYLGGTWAATWALGRLWFGDDDGRLALVKGLALAGVACLPIAVLEGMAGPYLYQLVHGLHPFSMEGRERSFGFRPMGLLEHGNQYGIWTSLCALAAVWLAWARGVGGPRLLWVAVALVAVAIGVAHQSRGAVLLLAGGMALMLAWRLRLTLVLLGLALLGGVALYALHYSGAIIGFLTARGLIPAEGFLRGSPAMHELRNIARGFGLDTLGYRIWQDLHTRELLLQAPLYGHGLWDWWRPADMRPWGLWQLIVGQFGLVGLALALWGWLLPALGRLWALRGVAVRGPAGAALRLALIALLAMIDALFNSFVFFPGLLAAAAVLGAGVRPAQPVEPLQPPAG